MYSPELLAFNIILLCFFLLLSVSSLVSVIALLISSKNPRSSDKLIANGEPDTNKDQNSFRLKILFSLFLMIGALGRSLYFVLDITNGFFENKQGVPYYIIPKSIIKVAEFVPTYFFGVLFIVLLLIWTEKYLALQIRSGNDELVGSAKRSIWWAERLFEFGILLYVILMLGDVIACIFIQIDEKGLVVPYLVLKNITAILLLVYMNITGILFLYFGFRLFLILHRLSKIVLSDTILHHRNKVLIVSLIVGCILMIKSGIILYHVISMLTKRGETPIESMLWIVIPYHFCTEILPLAFFQIYLWRGESQGDSPTNSEGSGRKDSGKEEDVLMPLYRKSFNI